MVKVAALLEALQQDLATLTPEGWSAALRAQPPGDQADARLTLRAPDGSRTVFLVEAKSRLEPSQVVLEFRSTERHPRLVVAPTVGPRSRELLGRTGTSWLEPGGDCRIVAGPILILREGRRRALTQSPASQVTRFVRNPFAGAALRVVRRLLIEPDRPWTVAEMSSATKVTIGFVSRTLATLQRDAYLSRRRGETRLKEYDDLLDAWTRAPQPLETTVEGVSLAKPGEVLAAIATLGKNGYALTAEAAAEQLAPFARFNKVELYVREFDRWQRQLQLTPVPVGANVRLIKSEDKGVFDGTLNRRGLQVVSLPQLYVDLKRREGAGPEAAAFLRQRFDKLRRELGVGGAAV
jgi:hypothetical protein